MVGICYVAPDIPVPSRRGSSTHVLELARALQGLGNQVYVLCRREKFQSEEEVISGVVFHRIYRGLLIPLPNRTTSGGSTVNGRGTGSIAVAYNLYLKTINALVTGIVATRLVKSHGLELVIERETAFGAGAVASMISGRPMILEIVGPDTSWLSASTSTIILAYNEKMVQKKYLDKVTFVKAAVNTEIFKPDPDLRAKTRKELGLDGSVVVGYVGTFQPWHGLEDLNQSINYLKGSGIPFKFLMVGPMGEPRREPRLMGGFPSVFTGSVPYEAVPAYINAADIMVAPYDTKGSSRTNVGIGSPLKILEYMACGKPTIASDLPQVISMVEDRRTGILYPEGNVRRLAASIEELALNQWLREELGRKALEKVRSEFTWLTFARRLQTLFEERSTRAVPKIGN